MRNTISTFGLKKGISLLLLVSLLNLITGCTTYYTVKEEQPVKVKEVRQMENNNKLLFVHLGDKAWILSNVKINDSVILGDLSTTRGHEKYKTTKRKSPNSYKEFESDVINEVHIYLSKAENPEKNEIRFSPLDVKKIETYNHDKGTTALSYTAGTLAVGGATALVIYTAVVLSVLMVFSAF